MGLHCSMTFALLDCIGSNSIKFTLDISDWIGLHWTGLDWVDMDYNRLELNGIERTGLDCNTYHKPGLN